MAGSSHAICQNTTLQLGLAPSLQTALLGGHWGRAGEDPASWVQTSPSCPGSCEGGRGAAAQGGCSSPPRCCHQTLHTMKSQPQEMKLRPSSGSPVRAEPVWWLCPSLALYTEKAHVPAGSNFWGRKEAPWEKPTLPYSPNGTHWHPRPAMGPYCPTVCPWGAPGLPEMWGMLRSPSMAQKTHLLNITSFLTRRRAAGLPGSTQLKAHAGSLHLSLQTLVQSGGPRGQSWLYQLAEAPILGSCRKCADTWEGWNQSRPEKYEPLSSLQAAGSPRWFAPLQLFLKTFWYAANLKRCGFRQPSALFNTGISNVLIYKWFAFWFKEFFFPPPWFCFACLAQNGTALCHAPSPCSF